MVVQPTSFPTAAIRASAGEAAAKPKAPEAGNSPPPSGTNLPAPPPIDTATSVKHLTEFLSSNARGLRFRVDDESGRTVVTVVNPTSGEVIRQIPSEELLQVANALRRYSELHLIDDVA